MKPKSISILSWIKAYLIHLKARTLCPWCAFIIICDLKQTGKVQLKRAVEQATEVISRFFKELSSKVTSCSKRCYTFFSTTIYQWHNTQIILLKEPQITPVNIPLKDTQLHGVETVTGDKMAATGNRLEGYKISKSRSGFEVISEKEKNNLTSLR